MFWPIVRPTCYDYPNPTDGASGIRVSDADREVQDNREGLELNWLHQLFVDADDVNMIGKNPQSFRENTGILLEASIEIGLEVNPEKTKYKIMSRDQNIVRNGNIKTRNLFFEEAEKFKYLLEIVTHINDTREEIKLRINIGNACYYSLEKLHSSSLLSKTPKNFQCGRKWLLHSTEEDTENRSEKGKKELGVISSGEKGVNTTMCQCIWSIYSSHDYDLSVGAPMVIIITISETDYINSELFVKWMQQFISSVHPTKERPVLLLLDGHTIHSKIFDALLYVVQFRNPMSLMLAGNEFQSLGRAIVKEDEYEEVRWDGIVSIVSWRERMFRLWWEERTTETFTTALYDIPFNTKQNTLSETFRARMRKNQTCFLCYYTVTAGRIISALRGTSCAAGRSVLRAALMAWRGGETKRWSLRCGTTYGSTGQFSDGRNSSLSRASSFVPAHELESFK
ncbi:hypothetical protein ANN_26796 [Periplaneta americana]|uniref:DDE-1 domain-containing protein n=1 Tax=Periplaneta americana TaxID=6978 RepID=A0ABQ8RZB1_PERAM|nr:hypothetical protein ANN_26796 [Periplaneta americana]